MNKSWLRQAIEDLEQDQVENYWHDRPVSDFALTAQVLGVVAIIGLVWWIITIAA